MARAPALSRLVPLALLLLATACPTGGGSTKTPHVDPTPVIGDHTEQRDPGAPKVDENALRAEVIANGIRVHVPVSQPALPATSAGAPGRLKVSVLDGITETERAHAESTVTLTPTTTSVALDLAATEPLFTHADGLGALGHYVILVEAEDHGGTTRVRRDLFRLVDFLAVRVTAPEEVAAGGTLALRVSVANRQGGVQAGVPVTARLGGGTTPDVSTTTDAQGEAVVELATPSAGTSSVAVQVEVGNGGSGGRWQGNVSLAQSRNLLLTTDKPRYQPGQMMHLRALAFTGEDRQPYQGALVFEVSDAKGNLLFKQGATANTFGVAAARFRVAQRVNEGTWKARVALGADGRGDAAARQVTVEKYVLPRFKVEVSASPSPARPGDALTVRVHAGYTFGVALHGGQVHLQASMKQQLLADQLGTLNDEGDALFTLSAPSTVDGKAGALELVAEVTDSAGGTAKGAGSVAVVPVSLVVQGWWANPLASVNGNNRLYVLLTDAAGTPVAGSVQASMDNQGNRTRSATMDAHGLAALDFTGLSGAASVSLQATAGSQYQYASLTSPAAGDGVDVRITPALLDARGDLDVELVAPGADHATLDVYARGSLWQRQDVARGADGKLVAHFTQVPGGMLRVLAHARETGAVGSSSALAREDRRLRLDIQAGADVYRPREEASVHVQVTDGQQAGAPSVLGLTVVDEAVYALADVSGPVKEFTEGAPLDAPPGLSADDVLAGPADALAAQALLAFGGNTGGVLHADLAEATVARARTEALAMVNQDAQAMGQAAQSAGLQPWSSGVTLGAWLAEQGFRDPWGNRYRFPSDGSSYYSAVTSLGPDEAVSSDDITTYVYISWGAPGREDDGEVQAGAGGPTGTGSSGGGSYNGGTSSGGAPATPTAAPRTEFPETLLVDPLVITDEQGRADVTLALPDSITTWRVGAVASDRSGRMGTGTGGVRVFQDFFVDLDVPTELSQDDEVAVTAVVNNFLETPQTLTLRATTGAWADVLSNAQVTVTVPAVSVTGVPIRVKAKQVGSYTFQLSAQGAQVADSLVKPVRVRPSGEERPFSFSDRLAEHAQWSVTVPADATPGATELLVRIHPGVQSEVVTGLESLLRMPMGCFEQTSSSNYPDVILLSYLRATGQTNPELEEKALGYLQEGYQRLTSYEVQGGGFSWFGDAPAHNVLTAYGLMEFVDMARVFPVDAALITRTADWLASQQKADGSFEPTQGGIAEGAINAFQGNQFRTTAFAGWALAVAGQHDDAVDRALSWLRSHLADQPDAYSLAVYENLLAARGPASSDLDSATAELLAKAIEENDAVAFKGAAPSPLAPSSEEGSAQTDLESTALAAHALIQAERSGDVASKALTFLARNKDSYGTWQSTQATIRSLQALLASVGSRQENVQGSLTVKLDGQVVGTFQVEPGNAALARIVDLSERATPGTHVIEIDRTGTGAFQAQVSGRSFGPRRAPAEPALTVTTSYSSTAPAVGEAVTVSVQVTSRVEFAQLMVDVPVPPGFDADLTALDAARTAGTVNRVELQGTHVLVYGPGVRRDVPVTLTLVVRPRLSAQVLAPAVRAYAYYDPSLSAESAPVLLSVP